MKKWLVQQLPHLNRAVKRALGVPLPEPEPPPPPPVHLDPRTWRPVTTDVFRPRTILFLLCHPSKGSGGLADILHLARELERQYGVEAWYQCVTGQALEQVRENVRWTDPDVPAERIVERLAFAPEFACATAWPSVYHALPQPSRRKLYYVQDYEPWFHRAGVARHYAAKSYELGLDVFTLGPWLAAHLQATHGLRDARPMPFPVADAADAEPPLDRRTTVAFYVQPDKEHRGTEVMIEGARRLVRELAREFPHLGVEIFGSADNEYFALDFPCTVRGVLDAKQMAGLLKRTRLGVCASFSNVSLMTLRFPVHGCPVLDVDLPSVRVNAAASAGPMLGLYHPDPESLVARSLELLRAPCDEPARRAVAMRLAAEHSWAACARSLAPLFTRN